MNFFLPFLFDRVTSMSREGLLLPILLVKVKLITVDRSKTVRQCWRVDKKIL